jgi:hypothetical protein
MDNRCRVGSGIIPCITISRKISTTGYKGFNKKRTKYCSGIIETG